jgi:hypothetical protein
VSGVPSAPATSWSKNVDLPRPPSDRRFKQLTAIEAGRALYIDFEGEKDRPPVLLGILRRRGLGTAPTVYQVVVDAEFDSLGSNRLAYRDAVERVVARAERRDRRIVSWTEYDLNVVRRLGKDEPELVARFESRYANARRVAERWMNKLHPKDKPADGKLSGYLALIAYPLPPHAHGGQVGETIKALRPALRAGRELTSRQQQRWDELLDHNRHDCAGMRAICLRATHEIESAD